MTFKKKKMIAFVQNGMLNIENQESENQLVELYNTSGQLLFSKSNLPQMTKIPVESFPGGVYILQIKSNNQTCQLKIIK